MYNRAKMEVDFLFSTDFWIQVGKSVWFGRF